MMVSVLSLATYLVIFASLVLCESNQPNNEASKKETREDISQEWMEGSSFTEVEEIFLDAQLVQLQKENLNLKQSLQTQQRQLENTRKINKQLADDKKESMEKNQQLITENIRQASQIGELQRDLQSTQATLYVLQPKLMLLQNNLTMTLQNFKNLTVYARNMESMLETELQLKSTHQEEASLERQMHQNTKQTLEDLETFSKFVMNLTKIQNARILKLENITTSMDTTVYQIKEKEKAYMTENMAYQNQIVIQDIATSKERDQKEKLKIALKQQSQLGKTRERMIRVLRNAMFDMTLSVPNCTSLATQTQKSQIDAHLEKEDTMKLLISQFTLFNSSSTNLQDVYVQMNSQLKNQLETKNEIINQQLKENKELVKSLEERKQLANIQSESLQLLKAEVDLLIPNDFTRTRVRRNLDGTIKSINLCQCIPEAPKASHLELSSIILTCPNDMTILRNDSETEQTVSLPCSGSTCSMEKSSWPKCVDNLQKAWTPWVYENCSQISIGNQTIQCGSGQRVRSHEVRSSSKDPWRREAVLEPCQHCNISQGDKITILPPALATALESLLEISNPGISEDCEPCLVGKCDWRISSGNEPCHLYRDGIHCQLPLNGECPEGQTCWQYNGRYFYSTFKTKCALYFQREEKIPTKGNLITTLTKLSKEYQILVDFKATSIEGDQSIIHFTTFDTNEGSKPGGRNPAVWITQKKIYIVSDIGTGSSKGSFLSDNIVPTNQWINLDISQKLENGKYMLTVLVDGEQKYQVENSNPKEYSNVKVYAGDPWYPVLNGTIRNFFLQQS